MRNRSLIHIYSLVKIFNLFTIQIKMYSLSAVKGIFLKIHFVFLFKSKRSNASIVLMVRQFKCIIVPCGIGDINCF